MSSLHGYQSPLESGINSSRTILPQNLQIQKVKVVSSYISNKIQALGDEYLKQSLLRINRSKSQKIQDSQISVLDSIELKGNSIFLNRSSKVTNYEQRGQKIFQLMLASKLNKQKAIEMLIPIESMLDRLSPQQIQNRLKQKLQIFSQLQKHQNHKNCPTQQIETLDNNNNYKKN